MGIFDILRKKKVRVPYARFKTVSEDRGSFSAFEHKLLKISGTMPTERLFHELTTRQFNRSARGKIKVEAKTEYKSRGNKSPHFADSLTLLIHGVRLNVAGPVGTAEKGSSSDEALNRFRPRTDATNRFQYLD